VNRLFRLVPTAVTPAMMATAIREAIRPYSIAVAPLSSFKNFFGDGNHSNLSLFEMSGFTTNPHHPIIKARLVLKLRYLFKGLNFF